MPRSGDSAGGAVQGTFALPNDISPSQITSNQNDYAPSGYDTCSVMRLDTDAARSITGIQGGADGRLLVIHYVGTTQLTLTKDDGATSTAANRFDFPADIVLKAKTSILLQYDATSSRWRAAARPVIGKVPVFIPAAAIKPRTTNGCAPIAYVETTTNKVMLGTLDHDASTKEYHQFVLPAIKGWDKGTITAVPWWKHASTTTNFGVCWGLQGVAISDDDAGDAAFGTAQEVTDTGGTTNDIYKAPETATITIAGSPQTGDLLFFQGYRDPANGADTMAIDAGLFGWMLYFNCTAPTED